MRQYWLKSFTSKQQKCFHDDLALPSKQFHFSYSKSTKFIHRYFMVLAFGGIPRPILWPTYNKVIYLELGISAVLRSMGSCFYALLHIRLLLDRALLQAGFPVAASGCDIQL